MRRFWSGLAIAIAFAAITAGSVVITQDEAPAAGEANLWMDADGGSCVRASTAEAYDNDGDECDSMEEAYSAATTGDTIRVKAATYPDQYFAGGAGATQAEGTKTLTWYAETGNKVRAIHIGSPNMTFDGFNLDMDGGVATGGTALFENGGESVTFQNGTIGDTTDSKGALIDGPNVTIDNVDFYDVIVETEGVHNECVQSFWTDNLVVRDSTFINCATMDWSMGFPDFWDPDPSPYSGVTLEGNYWGDSRFDNGVCCHAWHLALWGTAPSDVPNDDFGDMTNFTIRNNHFESGSDVINRLDAGTGNVICGNTGNVPDPSWDDAC